MRQAFGGRGDMDSLAKLADVLPVNAMDWPLSGDEKKKQLLRLYNEDVKTADSMLSSGEKALEALRDELDAVRKAAGVGKPVLTDAMLEKLSPRCGAAVDAEVERLRAAVESAAAVLRAICPTKDDPDDSELEDAGGRRRARSEGACRDSDAPPIRSAMCQTPRRPRRRKVSFGGQPEEEPSQKGAEVQDAKPEVVLDAPPLRKHRDSISLYKERAAGGKDTDTDESCSEPQAPEIGAVQRAASCSQSSGAKVHLMWFSCSLTLAAAFGTMAFQLGSSRTPPTAPDVIAFGDPACWINGFRPEYCCLGPQGNPMCWDEQHNFKRCCFAKKIDL